MEFENLITLINAVSDSTLTGLKYEENGVKIQLTKKEGKVKVIAAPAAAPAALPVPASEAAAIQPAAAAAVQPEASADEAADKPGNIVKSPLVGTFYAAPSEDAAPFV